MKADYEGGESNGIINRQHLVGRKGANEKLFQSSKSDKGAVVAKDRGRDQQAHPTPRTDKTGPSQPIKGEAVLTEARVSG